MLRPVSLLSASFDGPLTPRLGRLALAGRPGPAIRLSGDYRRGTLTRWRSAARRVRAFALVVVTAHHARSLQLDRLADLHRVELGARRRALEGFTELVGRAGQHR